MRVLVTGAGGFVAAHLIEFMLGEHGGVEVFGTERAGAPVPQGPGHRVTVLEANLHDREAVVIRCT